MYTYMLRNACTRGLIHPRTQVTVRIQHQPSPSSNLAKLNKIIFALEEWRFLPHRQGEKGRILRPRCVGVVPVPSCDVAVPMTAGGCQHVVVYLRTVISISRSLASDVGPVSEAAPDKGANWHSFQAIFADRQDTPLQWVSRSVYGWPPSPAAADRGFALSQLLSSSPIWNSLGFIDRPNTTNGQLIIIGSLFILTSQLQRVGQKKKNNNDYQRAYCVL